MLLVGLGNPGTQYKNNRHNIGFMVVDEIARKYGFSDWSKKFKGEWSEGRIPSSRGLTAGSQETSRDPAVKPRDDKVFLLKPQTFMNLSGESVQAAAAFFKIDPSQVIVFYDELDLPLGRLRVKRGGGNGGHNGLRSIDAHLGTDYWRVRIGIGHPGHKDFVTGHVLGDFSKEEQPLKTRMIETVALQLPLLTGGDEATFMSKVALEFHDLGAI